MLPIIPLLLVVFLLSLPIYSLGQERVDIGRFSQGGLENWEEKEFAGHTRYRLVEDDTRGWVLKARSDGTASGLVREIEVDLRATPYLNWSWKVEKLPSGGDERTKAGDDYASRVYVIFSVGPWFWDTRALNYVWSAQRQQGATWPNAFTDKACMHAVRSGGDAVGSWVEEKHHVGDDIFRCFGIRPDTIEAIAVMTDSDNTNGSATAYYGDIYFSAD